MPGPKRWGSAESGTSRRVEALLSTCRGTAFDVSRRHRAEIRPTGTSVQIGSFQPDQPTKWADDRKISPICGRRSRATARNPAGRAPARGDRSVSTSVDLSRRGRPRPWTMWDRRDGQLPPARRGGARMRARASDNEDSLHGDISVESRSCGRPPRQRPRGVDQPRLKPTQLSCRRLCGPDGVTCGNLSQLPTSSAASTCRALPFRLAAAHAPA